MKLNVGVGSDPWGDIRIDVVKNYRPNVTYNLLADACFLPFRGAVFYQVRVHEVLEHIENWEKALSECCRVCANEVSITFPLHADRLKLMWLQLFNPFLTLRTMRGIRRLRFQHKWQFSKEVLCKALEKQSFIVSKQSVIFHPSGTHPWLAYLAHRKIQRYFRWLTSRFRKPMRWHISACRHHVREVELDAEKTG